MEQYKQRKFVCKFCSKRFPCGKSLGGHIRTHMNENSDEDEGSKVRMDENGYALRENPKKNKRFVDQREMKQQLLCCRECGKGFISSKALCGHMACHSERDKIVMDSQSDTEASSSPIKRRSKRAAFQSNSGSCASEIEEEMALSLMMLSRDSSFKKGHNSLLAESSDNNSVILETNNKSSSGEERKMKNKLGDSDNSDSGYFENGPKKLHYVERNTNNNTLMRFNSSSTQQNNIWFKEGGPSSKKYKYHMRKSSKRGVSQKKIEYDFTESVYDSAEHSFETDSCAQTNPTIRIQSRKKAGGGKKKSKGHECPICFRVFKSGQALGGHKRSHFIGNQEHRTLVIQHQVAHEMHSLIDLNLPAPIDE